MKLRTQILLGILGTGVLAIILPMRSVAGDEMSPSIQAGDTVWILPGQAVRRGDVVVLQDPLDPSREVLRRAIAPGGTTVRFSDAGVRVDAKRLRQEDMGKLHGYAVYKETLWSKPPAKATDWLIRRRRDPGVHWKADPLEIPADHWYLLADDRDDALDSRWWGPIPTSAIRGVVRLRLTTPDLWRERLTVLQGTE